MFYKLLKTYSDESIIANLFIYSALFRNSIILLASFIFCLIMGKIFIVYYKKLKTQGQPIRNYITEIHLDKKGTPTMGGIIIIVTTIIFTILFANLANPYVWIVLFSLLSFGILGLIDDYTKIIRNNHYGIKAYTKLIVQIIISIIVISSTKYFSSQYTSFTTVAIPFYQNLFLGYFYYPFAIFLIVAFSNAVNLTDGLDGLAIGIVIIVLSVFIIITYLSSNYFKVTTYTVYLQELSIIYLILIGSALAFLWYNCKPANLFMGDTGSLSLGGVLGTISIITKNEVLLTIIGGVFVIETISVLLQVCYYKYTKGRRLFLMAPIHHHFEKQGIDESKIVIRLWILSIICASIALIIFFFY